MIMKNLTLYVTLSLILGIVSSRYNLIAIKIILPILPLMIAIVYYLIKKKKYLLHATLIFSFFVLGVTSCNYFSVDKLIGVYGHEVNFKGIITEISISKEEDSFNKYKANCSVYYDNRLVDVRLIMYLDKGTDIKPGMIIEGSGTINEPSKAGNFLEFDYKNYLLNRGIDGILFSDDYIIDNNIGFIYGLKNEFREYIIETIDDHLDSLEGGLLKGILLGDTDFIDDNLLENIRGLGTAHVLAVSGLHIGIIIASIGFILRLLRLNKRYALIISVCVGWVYAFFIGFPLSVFRALVMMTFVVLGYLLHRKYDMMNSIMNAVCLMLLIRPVWLFDMGFQMSFFAVIGICLFNKTSEFYEISKYLKYFLFIAFVQIFVFPISLYYFNQIPVLGLVANLLIVPIISIALFLIVVVLPLNIFSGFFSMVIFIFIKIVLKAVVSISELLMNIKFSVLNFKSPGFDEIVIYYFLILCILYFLSYEEEKYRFKYFYYSSVLTIFIYISIFLMLPSVINNSLKVSIINVGQGSASLVQYGNDSFMVDAGGSVRGEYEAADRILPEYLIKRGVGALDTIFVTHYHADHYSGIDKIDREIKIKNIISGHRDESIISDFGKYIDFFEVNSGDKIYIDDDFTIDVIWPPNNYESTNENNNSLVLLANFKGRTILFTGDIEKEVEDEIINRLDKVDIIVVPHHGSETSSSRNFLLKIKPDYGIMSYGENNYGIPSEEIIKRYGDIGTYTYETYIDGEIVILIDNKGRCSIKCSNGELNKKIDVESLKLMVASILLVLSAYMVVKE